jgi:hypothetical protein
LEKDEGVQGEKKRTFPQKVFSSPPAINQSSFITQPFQLHFFIKNKKNSISTEYNAQQNSQ